MADGANPEGGRKPCSYCEGSGKASGPRLFRSTCYHCEGRGFSVESACPTCNGEGLVSRDDGVKFKIPTGVATGQKVKLTGKGNAPVGSGEEGDLFVIVNVADHPLFRRRGDDLLVELPLTYAELALGSDVTVPTLEGTTTIRIPAGSEPGKILRLAGRGLPRVNRSGRGDLHLQIVLEVPDNLDPAQSDALADWAGSLPTEKHPKRAAFDRAVGDRST